MSRLTRPEARRYVRKMVAQQLASDIANGSGWLFGAQCGDEDPTFDDVTIARVHEATTDFIRSMRAVRRGRG